MRTRYIRLLHLYGEKLGNGVAGTTADITVLERDNSGNISRATGLDVPVDTTAGYAKGCVFIDTNVAAGTGGRYTNVGTTVSCNFDLEGTVSSGSVSADDLATAITPSHVVKYAGEVTWTGGGTSIATTVAGVLATDIVQATIQTVPTQAAYIVSCAVTADTITTTLSAANTDNNAVIAYTVFRAIA